MSDREAAFGRTFNMVMDKNETIAKLQAQLDRKPAEPRAEGVDSDV